MNPKFDEVESSDYQYDLPESRIAKYPLSQRSDAKLLVYKDGVIQHTQFHNLPRLLNGDYSLVFNNTRVIAARMHFIRSSGARIEVFLLQPDIATANMQDAMQATGECRWLCMIGNLKKWGDNEVLSLPLADIGTLHATLLDRGTKQVQFTWAPNDMPWYQVLDLVGRTPLPPYLNREDEEDDKETYQTVYASQEGAVAAPTAGLHFTDAILRELDEKNVVKHQLTLHVGAGTFQPLQEGLVAGHPMHKEQIIIDIQTIENLMLDTRHRIAVGTTSLRSLESIYWFGHMLENNPESHFFIPKLYPYEINPASILQREHALRNVYQYMIRNQIIALQGETEIMIMPGYNMQNADSLITNFHQPGSTLLVLISAITAGRWRTLYSEALASDYRFLSYGDSSWLIP
jgi:S-adenosylmethionine:tRNA ribosyltransferase-isomerase